MRHGEWAGYNPKGAVMDDGVSVWRMDVPYGNSRTARGPCAKRRACRLGCVSLILSLHKQRKNAPAASGTLHEKEDPSRKAIELEGSPWT